MNFGFISRVGHSLIARDRAASSARGAPLCLAREVACPPIASGGPVGSFFIFITIKLAEPRGAGSSVTAESGDGILVSSRVIHGFRLP